MSATYGIVYSRDAIEDLRDIGQYVSRMSGSSEVAQRQLRMIRDAVRRLETLPKRHPLVEDDLLARQGYRRMNVGSYAIFYLVDEGQRSVQVVRIAGGRRSLREALGAW